MDSTAIKPVEQLFVDAVCEWGKARHCRVDLEDPLLTQQQRAGIKERMGRHRQAALAFQALAYTGATPEETVRYQRELAERNLLGI